MPAYFFNYDFRAIYPEPYKPFVYAAAARRLLYVFIVDRQLFRLPNTTLWGYAENIDHAKSLFDASMVDAGNRINAIITLEKRLIMYGGPFAITSDKAKYPEANSMGRNDVETCYEHQMKDPFFIY